MKVVPNKQNCTNSSINPTWVKIVLVLFVCISINIHITSSIANRILHQKIEHSAEVVIDDLTAFTSLQQYFETRYNATASITYLLQPKSYVKIYKQCVFATTSSTGKLLVNAPTKVMLSAESNFQLELKNNQFVRISANTNFENQSLITTNDKIKVAYVFPIYQFKMHVAEIMLLYDNDKTLSETEIANITSEIQSMAALIH